MQSERTGGMRRVCRSLLATAALCTALSACVGTANAEFYGRSYVGQITGLTNPEALTVGPDDEVIIGDISNGLVYIFSAYPEHGELGTQASGGWWGGNTYVHSLAKSRANEFLYVGTEGPELPGGGSCNGNPFVTIDNFGAIYGEPWKPGCQNWVAVDNAPQSDSYGDYYIYYNSRIEKFDGYGNPVPFSGSASYINGNRLTGTPYGGLSSSGNPGSVDVAIDSEGNIWATNSGHKEIDKFSPSGEFLQRITEKSSNIPVFENPAGPHAWGGNLTGLEIDPTNGDVLVSDKVSGIVEEFSPQGQYIGRVDGSESPSGAFKFFCRSSTFCFSHVYGVGVNSQGYLYVADGLDGSVDVFAPRPAEPTITDRPDTNPTAAGGTVNALVDPNGGGDVTGCTFEYGPNPGEYTSGSFPCTPDPSGSHFSAPTEVHATVSGLTAETTYHYRFIAENASVTRIGPDRTFTPHEVLGLRADPATAVTAASATIHGSFVGNGAHTTYWFEYGTSKAYGKKTPLPAPPGGDAGSPAGPGRTELEASLTGLSPVTRYHYRIVAENGSISKSEDQSFRTEPLLPTVSRQYVNDVHSDRVTLHADVNPGGADTIYNFEYGTEPCSELPDPCQKAFGDTHIGSNLDVNEAVRALEGLESGTTYYYRALARNALGTQYGPVRTFSTYRFASELNDPCPNALARQQTGAALLSDCRAYELVSAAHAGGYDVESNLAPGQTPFDGYPRAEDPLRVLYGVHNGAIPGVPGEPTNRGVDPYVATRNEETGWSTSYVGIPANNPYATGPFASSLAEADQRLDAFAFAGPDICSPCFEDGTSGVPLHLPDGSLVQGMQGSIEPGSPAADDGLVKSRFSADGSHLVFSSTSRFEPAGNDSTGDVSIYDRNLETETTQVVSTDPSGNPLACLQGAGECHAPGDRAGIAELDISKDGSRVVVGQRIATDADGNNYYHLYMHVGGSPNSVDLTPGGSAGVLFDGMSEDGGHVFFTTEDNLLGDSDESADIFETEVDEAGEPHMRLITTKGGSVSNDDGCNPPGIPDQWNAISGEGHCNAVALAGGAGVAAEGGTFYFVSPEQLDGSEGEANQANLYVAEPGGDPEFVATIDSSTGKPGPQPPSHPSLPNFSNEVNFYLAAAAAHGPSDDYVYLAQGFAGSVARFKADGTPADFTAGPNAGTNELTGFSFSFGESQMAVDNSNGPLAGALYVASSAAVRIFAESGEELGELSSPGEACGVAVNQNSGVVYVGDYFGKVWRYEPQSGSPPVSDASYNVTSISTTGLSPCPVGTDSGGHVFAAEYGGAPVEEYNDSSFESGSPPVSGTELEVPSVNAIDSDPETHDIYINTGDAVIWMNSAREVIAELGAGSLSGFSYGVAFNPATRHLYAADTTKVLEWGYNLPPYHPIEDPAVLHGVHDSGTHRFGDFQVTPSGRFAAFTTRQPLEEGFENLGHGEVYRYDHTTKTLDCVSCPPTNSLATADANLATNGLSLSDDGRMFFDTGDSLVLRDGDNRTDVYEWEEGGVGPSPGGCDGENPNLFPNGDCLSLISTGKSQFESRLLSATASGHDAFFFTHDTLAHEDENGPVTKIYDARTGGGFFDVPPPALCAASDECHGPGTQAAPTPPIRTKAGTAGNPKPKKRTCRRGFVKKHGKCVRRKRRKHHRKRRKHHRKHTKKRHHRRER